MPHRKPQLVRIATAIRFLRVMHELQDFFDEDQELPEGGNLFIQQFSVLTDRALPALLELHARDRERADVIGYSLAAPIGDSIARDLNQVIDRVLADACLRVLEKAQHNPLPEGTGFEDPGGDRPDGSIGSFTCAFPRTAQILGDTLPSGVLKNTTCVLAPGAVIPAAPQHCLIEVQPPDTFWSGFWDYFGQGPKKRYFDAAFVNRRSLK